MPRFSWGLGPFADEGPPPFPLPQSDEDFTYENLLLYAPGVQEPIIRSLLDKGLKFRLDPGLGNAAAYNSLKKRIDYNPEYIEQSGFPGVMTHELLHAAQHLIPEQITPTYIPKAEQERWEESLGGMGYVDLVKGLFSKKHVEKLAEKQKAKEHYAYTLAYGQKPEEIAPSHMFSKFLKPSAQPQWREPPKPPIMTGFGYPLLPVQPQGGPVKPPTPKKPEYPSPLYYYRRRK